MSLHAAVLVRAGLRRVARPAGGVLLVGFLAALGAVNASLNTLLTAASGTSLPGGVVVAAYGVTLPGGPLVAAVALAAGLAVTSVLAVVGVRLLGDDGDGRWRSPRRCLTQRTLPAAASVAAVVCLGVLALPLGVAALVVPGVLVAAYLLVVPGVVALEGVGPVEAVHRTTKRLTRGRALALAGAAVTLVAAALVVASLSYFLRPATEFALGVALGGTLAVCWVGVTAEAHARLGGSGRPTQNRTARSTPSSRAL
jgi:hypothetical protein